MGYELKKRKQISSNLDPNYQNRTPQTPETKPTIPGAADTISPRLKIDHDLSVNTTADLPGIDGAVGKILFHSMKSSDNETNLVEIVNNTTGNKSYILLHPSGSFEVYNNNGDHVLKAVGDQIIVGSNVTIEAAGEVSIVSSSEITPLDEIVTVTKLKTYLSTVMTPGEAGVPVTGRLPIFTPTISLADLGTKQIKVGKS